MPMPKTRPVRPVRLTVTSAGRQRETTQEVDAAPFLPWPIASLAAGVAAAVGGWLLITGVVLVSWFTAMAMPIPTVLHFASQVWLLAHGEAVLVGGIPLSVAPLGLTLGAAALVASTAAWAARQALLARTQLPGVAERGRLLFQVAVLVVVGYLAVAIAISFAADGSTDVRAAVGAAAIAGLAATLGAAAALQLRFASLAPVWLARVVRGAAAGLTVLVLAGVVALSTAILSGSARIAAIEDSLLLDPAGIVVWSIAAMLYLPTLVIWATSWVLGAGISLGAGSVVSLSGSQLGMVPAIPILGALPTEGVTGPWMLTWLVWGLVAGIAAGMASARRGASSGLGNATWVGAVAGVATALATVGLAALSRGDLGQFRLVGLGPDLAELALIAAPLLGLAAALAGLLTRLHDRRHPLPAAAESAATEVLDPEATVLLGARHRGSATTADPDDTVLLRHRGTAAGDIETLVLRTPGRQRPGSVG